MTGVPTLTGQDTGEAAEAVRALLGMAAASTGHSASEFLALRVLALRGPITPPSALRDFLAQQRQFGLDHAASTELLTRLEGEGWSEHIGPPTRPGRPTRATPCPAS